MRKVIGVTFGIMTLGLVLQTTQAAADFHDGIKCYQDGDIECATKEFRPVADTGNAAAQYLLGMIYLNELASPPSDESGEGWLVRAGDQDNVQAQTELARMYRDGDGVAADISKMTHWYKRAAENGDVGAQLMLADTYAWGDPENQRYGDAYMWYTIAIDYWGTHAERARDAIESKLTSDEARGAVDRARAWLKAHQGDE